MTILGIDIGGTSIKFGVITDNEIAYKFEITNDTKSIRDFKLLLSNQVKNLTEKFTLSSIGVGIPGKMNNNGIVISSPNLKYLESENLINILNSITDYQIFIENDAFLAAYAESKINILEEYYFITLGTGIGSALVKDKSLVVSSNGSSGELGHIIININEIGDDYRTGIFEQYFNPNQFVKKAISDLNNFPNSFLHTLEKFSIREISDGVAMGDDLCIINFIEMGTILGIGLSSVANLTGIANFVIGGGISNTNSLLFESARKEMIKRVIPELTPFINIHTSELTNNAGILGAAYYAKDKLL